jgi:pyruvate,water dikinase
MKPPRLQLSGTGASPGIAHGAVALFDRDNDQQFESATIIVAETLPISLQELNQNVVGIVTEEGGLLCHAACIARELGIPCVVGIPNACIELSSLNSVCINGDRGEVYEIDCR